MEVLALAGVGDIEYGLAFGVGRPVQLAITLLVCQEVLDLDGHIRQRLARAFRHRLNGHSEIGGAGLSFRQLGSGLARRDVNRKLLCRARLKTQLLAVEFVSFVADGKGVFACGELVKSESAFVAGLDADRVLIPLGTLQRDRIMRQRLT